MPNTRPPPCPFCGKLSWRFFCDPGTWATAVECTYCGARGPLTIPDEDTALAAWAERAQADAADQHLVSGGAK